jgi:hypothetical protein
VARAKNALIVLSHLANNIASHNAKGVAVPGRLKRREAAAD